MRYNGITILQKGGCGVTVILTGGASRRMGRDKATLPVGGRTLVEVLAERYSANGGVAVSAANSDMFPQLNCPILPDVFPGMGPLNGIVSAFEQTDAEYIFLTAVDLPNGSAELARYICDELTGADVCVIEREDGKTEPVFAAYSRTCGIAARQCLEAGERSFKQLFARLNVRIIPERELPDFDLDRILFNMNTPEDYKKILEEM
jgi:molybdopterin-guanine dinucleotide biosynthesis protein A